MRKIILLILLLLIFSAAFVIIQNRNKTDKVNTQTESSHIYASWDTKEYDKCVAIWLIKRFVDSEAEFVFHPAESDIQEGVVFDVPGAAWSRQHRRCTSDCIQDTLALDDPAVVEIVAMAHNIELNFWQLDSFPQAQKSFQEVLTFFDEDSDKERFIAETLNYFDQLYLMLKEKNKSNQLLGE